MNSKHIKNEAYSAVIAFAVAAAVSALITSQVYAHGEEPEETALMIPFMAVLTYGQVPNPDPQDGAAPPSAASGQLFGYLKQPANEFVFSISFRGLQGTISMVHFHGPAVPGSYNTDHYFDICCEQGDPYPVAPGGTEGAFDGGTGRLSQSEMKDLKRGLWYINIHTDLYPTAELRGQVIPLQGVRYLQIAQ